MSSNKFIIKMQPGELVPKSSARIFYYMAFWVTVLQAATVGFLWKYIPRVVPLFFTQPWGEARLAPKLFIFLIPLLSLASIVVNLILGKKSKDESEVLSYALAVASLVMAIMFAIAIAGILQSIV